MNDKSINFAKGDRESERRERYRREQAVLALLNFNRWMDEELAKLESRWISHAAPNASEQSGRRMSKPKRR